MPGVAFDKPPEHLIPNLSQSIKKAVADLPEGKQGAIVAVVTTSGVNAAVVAKLGNDWQVQSWIGKKWDAGLDAGAAVTHSW